MFYRLVFVVTFVVFLVKFNSGFVSVLIFKELSWNCWELEMYM